ncbi:MFS transporter [Sphingosinicellaceae bacterium]|nr:MFS transporter [Sphingosinicellaceae bacterium]
MASGGVSRVRSLVGGSIGNLVEWYDFYAYSALSLYFAHVFFPEGDPTAQLLNTAAVFAIGFLMRPVGGWWLGVYADRHGRKAALSLSVLLMASGSAIVALCPGFGSIGVAAPTILVLARLLQGLSVGGEYGASATYMSEIAGKRNRGFAASFQYVTLIGGQLLALGVVVLLQQHLSDAELSDWGWRIPFAIGSLGALVALWLRRGIAETEAFQAVPAQARSELFARLWVHRRSVLLVVMLGAGGSLAFYTFTTYMQKFLVNSAGWTKAEASATSAATLLGYLLLQPLFGALSDRIGRRPLLIAFGVLGILGTVPVLTALGHAGSQRDGFLLILAALTVLSCYTSISGLVKAELFPAAVRALGVGLPYAVSVSLFGGTAEYVALWFKKAGHEAGFFWYVSAMIGVSLVAALLLPDTRDACLIED